VADLAIKRAFLFSPIAQLLSAFVCSSARNCSRECTQQSSVKAMQLNTVDWSRDLNLNSHLNFQTLKKFDQAIQYSKFFRTDNIFAIKDIFAGCVLARKCKFESPFQRGSVGHRAPKDSRMSLSSFCLTILTKPITTNDLTKVGAKHKSFRAQNYLLSKLRSLWIIPSPIE